MLVVTYKCRLGFLCRTLFTVGLLVAAFQRMTGKIVSEMTVLCQLDIKPYLLELTNSLSI